MSKDNQPRLFDVAKVTRSRKTYKRVKRSQGDITPYVRFLRTYRMLADTNNGKVKLKRLQDQFHIGHFARTALPTDLMLVDERLINEDYATEWRARLYNYYKDCDRQGERTETKPVEPIIVIPEPVASITTLEDVFAELENAKKQFDTIVENCLAKAMALIKPITINIQ